MCGSVHEIYSLGLHTRKAVKKFSSRCYCDQTSSICDDMDDASSSFSSAASSSRMPYSPAYAATRKYTITPYINRVIIRRTRLMLTSMHSSNVQEMSVCGQNACG